MKMIPKIVHQTWCDNKLPKIFQEISNENKRINNDFEFKLWRDDDNEKVIEKLLEQDFPKVLEIYNKSKFGVQKADIKRIAILYYFGGIYIDLDIMFLKPITDLIDFDRNNDVFLALEPDEQTMKVFNKKNLICNAFICAPPKHAIMEKALKNIEKLYEDNGDRILNIFNSFGGDILAKSLMDEEGFKLIKRDLIYPISDPKLDIQRSENDIQMLKNASYNDAFMVHYWIHSNFESKELIKKYVWNHNVSVNQNVYLFFKMLYTENKYLNN
jgi:hypothetical protein